MPRPEPIEETDAVTLCTTLLVSGNEDVRFSMTWLELVKAVDLPWLRIEAAINWAVRRDWLRRGRDYLELKAAGIYVAKETLDLPR